MLRALLHNLIYLEIGYKLREMISKSLSARSKVLKSSITKYNALARNADPPRPELTTRDVMEMTKVADFKLLRESRHNILAQKWARPEIREATTHALRVDRAREELIRIQVEARRLQTWMRDETYHLDCTLRQLEAEAPLLAHVLRLQVIYQTRINSTIMDSIRCIESHQFYDGKSGCGTRRKGADLTGYTLCPHVVEKSLEDNGNRGENDDEGDSDSDSDVDDEMANLADGYDRIVASSCT
jgi:hypothetical protein